MTNAQYSDICQSMRDVRDAVMRKEMDDIGWDLRGELLALQAVVSQLAAAVYENHYVAAEKVRPVDPVQIRPEFSRASTVVKDAERFDPNIYEDEDD